MNYARKICVITGTRSEYGLLSRLMKIIQNDENTKLQIIATNMHLSTIYGLTCQEIENEGFVIDYKVYMLEDDMVDTANATVKSIGRAINGFADAYDKLSPDLIVILGDRYEMLAAASAALIFKIPVAHLYGGEITQGAYDDAIRHAITKMSHIHFTSTEQYRKRVIQLGESPNTVFYVGSLGVENILTVPLMKQEVVENVIHFKINRKTVIATYHPVTLSNINQNEAIDSFLSALHNTKDIRFIFTMPNSDTGGKIIIEKIHQFVINHPECSIAISSLGMKLYLSVLQYIGGVIGNSSSGIIEVPSFGIPTLNIGERQKGRILPESVINCSGNQQAIENGLKKIFSKKIIQKAKNCYNPYQKTNTAQLIFNILKTNSLENIIQKQFYDI